MVIGFFVVEIFWEGLFVVDVFFLMFRCNCELII